MVAMLMFSMSCSNEPINEPINGSQDVDFFSKATQSSVPVFERPGGFPDGDFLEITGATSTIKRNKNGIVGNISTSGLIPNNAYTMWFVVFADTQIGPPPSYFAAGHLAGGSGKGNFSARLNAGPEFQNPLTAEVHMVIRSHGQAVPGMIPNQIHTFDEGCSTVLPQGPGRIWPDSDELGRCANVQVAIHPPN